ncbi:MAG: hypothetical protein IJI27_09390 [Oscillospiraceae bacterium]|nr:hypothetical protein [Oscillospiraceae bacterium]
MKHLNWKSFESLSKQDATALLPPESQGHTDSRVECRKTAARLATSVALLIELKAQVLQLVT